MGPMFAFGCTFVLVFVCAVARFFLSLPASSSAFCFHVFTSFEVICMLFPGSQTREILEVCSEKS